MRLQAPFMGGKTWVGNKTSVSGCHGQSL